jgi:hypothetical protein
MADMDRNPTMADYFTSNHHSFFHNAPQNMLAKDGNLLSQHLFLLTPILVFVPFLSCFHAYHCLFSPSLFDFSAPRAQFDAVLNALVMQTSLLASQVTRRGIRIVVYIVLLAHVFTCFWFYLGWARVSDAAGTAWGLLLGVWIEGV